MVRTLDTTIERLCARIEAAPAGHKNELRLQLIRMIVFRAVRPQPKAPPALPPRRTPKRPKARRAPTGWRCADCGTSGRRSLKNAAYCAACARSQPIGAMV